MQFNSLILILKNIYIKALGKPLKITSWPIQLRAHSHGEETRGQGGNKIRAPSDDQDRGCSFSCSPFLCQSPPLALVPWTNISEIIYPLASSIKLCSLNFKGQVPFNFGGPCRTLVFSFVAFVLVIRWLNFMAFQKGALYLIIQSLGTHHYKLYGWDIDSRSRMLINCKWKCCPTSFLWWLFYDISYYYYYFYFYKIKEIYLIFIFRSN